MKINLVGLLYDRNMGDPLLFDCTRYLLKTIIGSENCSKDHITPKEITIENTDILQRDTFCQQMNQIEEEKNVQREKYRKVKHILGERIFVLIKDVILFLSRAKGIRRFRNSEYRRELDDYYQKKFLGADCVIIIGAGTFKYHARMDFGGYYESIISVCHKLEIPVIISCVGIESMYDRLDPRCYRFVKCVNHPIVKYITTRDKLSHIIPYIRTPHLKINQCTDVGVYASKAYNITKDIHSKIIGIGIITYKRFVEFGRGISKELYENLIYDIISEFENSQVDWLFFNNGDNEDASYQSYLCKKFGLPKSKMMRTPNSPRELVYNISQLGGVITSRLHSCIVSYSLDIPFVAIAWNDKLYRFAERINHPEAVVGKNQMDARLIISKLNMLISEGYNQEEKKLLMQSTYDCFINYLK